MWKFTDEHTYGAQKCLRIAQVLMRNRTVSPIILYPTVLPPVGMMIKTCLHVSWLSRTNQRSYAEQQVSQEKKGWSFLSLGQSLRKHKWACHWYNLIYRDIQEMKPQKKVSVFHWLSRRRETLKCVWTNERPVQHLWAFALMRLSELSDWLKSRHSISDLQASRGPLWTKTVLFRTGVPQGWLRNAWRLQKLGEKGG